MVSENECNLFLLLLRRKSETRDCIEKILIQNTVFARIETAAQKKKTISDMQNILRHIVKQVNEGDDEMRKQIQNFLRHLCFHADVLRLLPIAGVDATLMNPLFKGIIKFLYTFCLNDSGNQALLLPYAKDILELRNHHLKVSKLVRQIFMSRKDKKKEHQIINDLLDKVKEDEACDPDIIRLIAALAESATEKHSVFTIYNFTRYSY